MASGPLTSLKILDFSQLLPGPFCSLLLADMGADVIKVEHPDFGDGLRQMAFLDEAPGVAFAYLNRNKRSLAIDLKQPDARALIQKLVQDYDIVIEGFRPGVMARLGLDYESLRRFNPALIYCSISGYGQDGPLASRAGHDLNYISRAGVASLSGIGGVPVMPGVQLADMMGAHQAAIGVLAADIHRRQSGEGQFIDISLMESTFTMASIYAAGRLSGCSSPEMEQLPLTGKFPHYRFYRCGDGQYLAVAALEERFQRRLSASLGIELAFDSLEALFATRSRDDWYQALQDVDACVEPVLSLDEVLNDPHLRARRPVIEVGGFSQPAPAIRFSQTPCTEHTPAPAVGEHNQDLQI